MLTPSGTSYLQGMMDSEYPITLKIENITVRGEDGNLKGGKNMKSTVINTKTGIKRVTKILIEIYEGSVKESLSGEYKGLSLEEAIGAVAAHESGHADPENIKLSLEKKDNYQNDPRVEKSADIRENIYKNEIKNKKEKTN